MKKRLLSILLMCCMVLTMLPGMTAYAAADDGQSRETLWIECLNCRTVQNLEIIEYTWKIDGYPANEQQHWLHTLCPNCHHEDYYLGEDHTGGTETPTCTRGKTCEKCGGEYGKLGHDWGDWQSSGDNNTHTRSCQREGCNAVDTASCGGDGAATCTEKGYTGDTHCKGCGVKLEDDTDIPALDHDFGAWTSNGDGTHTRVCKRDATHKET